MELDDVATEQQEDTSFFVDWMEKVSDEQYQK
jgi:hypothetical protein